MMSFKKSSIAIIMLFCNFKCNKMNFMNELKIFEPLLDSGLKNVFTYHEDTYFQCNAKFDWLMFYLHVYIIFLSEIGLQFSFLSNNTNYLSRTLNALALKIVWTLYRFSCYLFSFFSGYRYSHASNPWFC